MKATLLDKPEDYKKLGVNPDKIEIWEDRRRNTDTGPNNWEWWYFDAILDDGSTAVIQFFTKSGIYIEKKGDHPTLTIKITDLAGTHHKQDVKFKVGDTFYGNDGCDIKFGKNIFKGNLKEYHIFVEPTEGVGADLKLTSVSQSYRPGTAYFNFGSEDKYYTWLCLVPKGKVEGTMTYGGKTIKVSGFGYHDHQWGSVNFQKEWNHWVWARQSFDDYSMLVFDMVSSKNTEFTRFPIVFIQDKDGNIIFENTQNVECRVLDEYHDDEASGKDYPKGIQYIFENNEKRADYLLSLKKIIEERGTKNIPLPAKLVMKTMGINPAYSRYLSDGKLKLTIDNEVIERSGELIYEFMYPGETFKGHI